ncbi:MAG: BON domain-containing protein, partial [Pirellulaceae bacterium]
GPMRRLLFGLAIASIAALLPCQVHAGDQQVAQRIVQQLRQHKADGQLKGFGIDLEVESGIVWLKGHVQSQKQQALVIDVARRVDGVEQVINDVEIKAAPSSTASRSKSRSKSHVQPALLRTESAEGLLKKPGELLAGFHQSMQHALRPGDKDSKKPARTKADRQKPSQEPKGLLTSLRSSVERTFRPTATDSRKHSTKQRRKKRPDASRAAPSPQLPQLAKAKSARPTPARPTPAQTQSTRPEPVATRKQSTETSSPTRGETRPSTPSDEQLAKTVVGKLRAQKDRGILKDFDVDLQVNDRIVWVSGHVASETQRNLVLDVTRRVRGVKKVVNDLDVGGEGTPAQVVASPSPSAASVTQDQEPTPAAKKPTSAGSSEPADMANSEASPSPSQAPTSQAPAPFQYAPTGAGGQTQGGPVPFAPAQSAAYQQQAMGQPVPEVPAARGAARARFDNPTMPGYAWPSYAAYPNYGAVTYPRQYSPTAWPYIGPFYPYPQVPLGWRKVTLEWDDGWWMLDFKNR